jgi:hypothetical protein
MQQQSVERVGNDVVVSNMISVKEAAKIASEFGSSLWDDAAWKATVRLEEVEKGELDGIQVWFITLSVPGPGANFLNPAREYKRFAVHGESGEVLSVKIREVAGVHA